ncbi:MAG: hypothetical protein JWM64_1812 [Frankiales bacterium]|nr:hypothetical protein [Frankiales bacterium]
MDLSSAMRSPSLELLPPPGLDEVVRRRAGRVRRRRRAAGSVLGVAAVVGAVAVVPGLGLPGATEGQLATPDRSYGIRTATSEVLLLERLNGADVVAYYEDDEPCVAAIRVKRDRDCGPGVSSASLSPLPYVFPADDPSLRVDARQLVAGLLGASAQSVRVTLADGRSLPARTTRGRGFALPVFAVEVPAGALATAVEALGPDGALLQRRPLTREG